jgi:very-short-patch-repair endonuclease
MRRRHSTSSDSVVNARNLRSHSTPSEKILWESLRNRRLDGLKFRRQYPVDRWIIDFFCLEKMLGVEVDGPVHNKPRIRTHDQYREEYLHRMGIRILRIPAERIVKDLPAVLQTILSSISPSPDVSQERGLGGEEGEEHSANETDEREPSRISQERGLGGEVGEEHSAIETDEREPSWISQERRFGGEVGEEHSANETDESEPSKANPKRGGRVRKG